MQGLNSFTTTANGNCNTSNNEKLLLLFGSPIAHSLSPLMHNTVYRNLGLPWKYQLFDSTSMSRFLELTRDLRFAGASVTMPHKVTIMDHLDGFTEEGREVGACNTVFVSEDSSGNRKLIGTNTDIVGIREAILQNVPNPSQTIYNKPGLIIGGGGAARSAAYVLHKWFHCPSIYIVNRDQHEVEQLIQVCSQSGFGSALMHIRDVKEAENVEELGTVIGCVPDLPPQSQAEKELWQIINVILRKKAQNGALLEMAYHPRAWTNLCRMARGAEWQVIPGTEVMIWQGLEQDRLWTNLPYENLPVKTVQKIIAAKLGSAAI